MTRPIASCPLLRNHGIGLVGDFMLAGLGKKHFWTLLVWEDEQALMTLCVRCRIPR